MRLFGQLSRFLVVGLLNTAMDLVVLNAETLLTGVKEGAGYALQKGISFCVAVVLSYFVNKYWTFGAAAMANRRSRFYQFLGVSVMGAAINIVTATVVVTHLKDLAAPHLGVHLQADQLWVNIGALCGTGASFFWNFLGYKHIVFKP